MLGGWGKFAGYGIVIDTDGRRIWQGLSLRDNVRLSIFPGCTEARCSKQTIQAEAGAMVSMFREHRVASRR
jgi:hypothetical protein